MKKKLSNKLSLKKETLGSLNTNQMNDLKGGGTLACPSYIQSCGCSDYTGCCSNDCGGYYKPSTIK